MLCMFVQSRQKGGRCQIRHVQENSLSLQSFCRARDCWSSRSLSSPGSHWSSARRVTNTAGRATRTGRSSPARTRAAASDRTGTATTRRAPARTRTGAPATSTERASKLRDRVRTASNRTPVTATRTPARTTRTTGLATSTDGTPPARATAAVLDPVATAISLPAPVTSIAETATRARPMSELRARVVVALNPTTATAIPPPVLITNTAVLAINTVSISAGLDHAKASEHSIPATIIRVPITVTVGRATDTETTLAIPDAVVECGHTKVIAITTSTE